MPIMHHTLMLSVSHLSMEIGPFKNTVRALCVEGGASCAIGVMAVAMNGWYWQELLWYLGLHIVRLVCVDSQHHYQYIPWERR